ncbi:putative VV A32-like packaging ATPase [Chlorella virus XW01]|nr:putative VV A32-like packaging ATPase [Chlorella virus XW01]
MTDLHITYGQAKLKIKRFDLKKMAENCTIAMIAKRASGKSYLTREILYHKRDLPAAIAISRTEKLNTFYGEFIPDIYIYNEFDTSILSKIIARQAKMNEDNRKRLENGKKPKDDRLMIIMDDCMSSKGTWVKDQNILELFFNGRHHHLSFILTMQFALGIPPEMRSNFDYIFLLAEDFKSNRKRLYEHYAGMFPSLESFEKVFSDITQNYGVMVIDNRVHSTDITEKVFWYKAKETPKFTLGSKKYIKYHKKKYDKNHNIKLPLFDPNSLIRRKNNLKLIVERVK